MTLLNAVIEANEEQLRDFRDQMRSPRSWPTLGRTLEWVRVFGELVDELRSVWEREPWHDLGGEG